MTREDSYAQGLRRRSELPAHLGRYLLVMLGAIVAAAAFGLVLTRPSLSAGALVAFGAFLVGLGIVQHLLLVRGRKLWPDTAFLWAEGIELVLHNGEVRALSWNDPGLALDIYVRPLPGDPVEETLLVWKSDRRVPPCQLSSDGFDRLRLAAHDHGLEVREYRDEARKRGMRAFEIRPGPLASPARTVSGGPAPSNQ